MAVPFSTRSAARHLVLRFLVASSLYAVVVARSVNWYLGAWHHPESNEQFAKDNQRSMTGVYLCCDLFNFTADGTFLAPSADDVADQTTRLRALSLDLYYVMAISPDSVRTGSWKNSVDAAAQAAVDNNIKGYIVDYEPKTDPDSDPDKAREEEGNYASFLSALAAAMHKQGKTLGFDTAGWGILQAWDVYRGTGVDIFTSMTPTYSGKNLAANRQFVQDQLKAGIPAEKIGVGIGTMLAPGIPPPKHESWAWTEQNLRCYVEWLATNAPGVSRLDCWRADINHYKTTAPWFLQIMEQFLAQDPQRTGGSLDWPALGGSAGCGGGQPWDFCSTNDDCECGCCSKQYSDDGKYKCTPGGSADQCTGVPDKLPDWDFCTSNSQCADGCCSKQYSDDGKFKCTPGGTPSQCTGPQAGAGPPLGDLELCASSAQCASGCCSPEQSDDGRPKCIPKGSSCGTGWQALQFV